MRRAILLITLLILLTVPAAAQQGDRVLTPDLAVEGEVSVTEPAQVYLFDSAAGDVISLTLEPQAGLALTLAFTDADGSFISQLQIVDADSPRTLDNVRLERTGTYYVTIFPTPGVETILEGSFVITLSYITRTVVETPEPTQVPQEEVTFQQGQVNMLNGMQVTLTWNTQDDLNLQVREPTGESLFWDSRTTASGGSFGLDANGLCEVLTEPPAVETASWSPGSHAIGSYEILVYYRQSCANAQPVDFTVQVTVDGQPLDPIQGSVPAPVNNIANVFISSYTVNSDGSASVGTAGPYTDTQVLPISAQDILALPDQEIVPDLPVSGLITNDQPWQTYTFNGNSGETVSLNMTATEGSLDTLVLVLDSAGVIVGANDDIESAVNTNSAINNLRLPTTDTYTVFASRYGKDVGGTEGRYQLALNRASANAELAQFDLPNGDIQVLITWETNAELRLLVRDPFGDSVFNDETAVQSGGRLEVSGNINCTVSEGTPISYIYWPEGFLRIGSYEVDVWYRSQCDDFRPVVFNIFIVVDGQLIFTDTVPIEFTERYLTSFTIDQNRVATGDVGGIIGGSETLNIQSEQAAAVALTGGESIPGSITPQNKFDLYTFEGLAGDVVTVSMNRTSGTLDTLLFLLDPFGIEIATNDDANDTTNSLINNVRLSQDGTYTIVATHFGTIYGGTIGGYDLALRNEN